MRCRLNFGRGNTPRCRHGVGICRRHRFEFALGSRCTEFIVRERARRPVERLRVDTISDAARLADMGRTIRYRRARTGLQEVPFVPRHLEHDIGDILRDNARTRCRRRICRWLCDQIFVTRQREGCFAVIDFRCISRGAARFAHLKTRVLDQASRDRTLSCLRVRNTVVVIAQES